MAIDITENQIKRFGAKVGIRNFDKAAKFVTGKSPVEKRWQTERDHQRMSEIKVEVEVDESSLSLEKQRLLEKVITFAQITSLEFQDKMHRLMSNYEASTGSSAFTPEMEQKMKERGYDLPRFTIKNGKAAQQFIEEIGESRWWEPRDDTVLLVYDLPPPLSRFWNRGTTNSEDEQLVEVGEGEVEWGYFYREVTPVIWGNVGFEANEGDLTFDRINGTGQHGPLKYYYVWEVSESKWAEHWKR